MKIPPEILKHYITNIKYCQIEKEIPKYLESQLQLAFEKENDHFYNQKQIDAILDDIIEYVWKFNFLHLKLDWFPVIRRLLVRKVYNFRS